MSYLATKSHNAWKERIEFEGYLTRLHSNNYSKTFYSTTRTANNYKVGNSADKSERRKSSVHRRDCYKEINLLPEQHNTDCLKSNEDFLKISKDSLKREQYKTSDYSAAKVSY